ncbi:MAG TPA: nucleotidyltransferase domain-containing protein [Candidatus Nanoarchaeia archaeon]|nr:nucleotidyltransferase domain-containing protein [Candidatus Nanoarchaeia archaeon]
MGKIQLSQKAIALTLDELEKQGILKSRRQANLKYFSLNIKNQEVAELLITTELIKKINFLKKHRKLANIFKQDNRIVGIFGSYARGQETENSDVDLFIIGKKAKQDYNSIGKLFDVDISIKYFTEKQFNILIKEKNNLCREIIENHVLIFGIENFINTVWRDYYGFY